MFVSMPLCSTEGCDVCSSDSHASVAELMDPGTGPTCFCDSPHPRRFRFDSRSSVQVMELQGSGSSMNFNEECRPRRPPWFMCLARALKLGEAHLCC